MPGNKKRSIQPEDLYRFQLLNEVRLSPDGLHVIYTVQRVDRKTEKKYSNLWVVDTATAQARQFTWGDQSDSMPRWSPDGQRIAFLSNRLDKEKPAQIFIIPFTGGEARPLNGDFVSIGALVWSPDGKRLLCQARKKDAEVIEREKDEQKKKLGVVARHYDRLFYKLDGFGYLPKERWHLWTVEESSGKAVQLTDHPVFDERDPAWSPDGKWIAFLSNRNPEPDANLNADDLFIMPASGGEIKLLPTPPSGKSLPIFSPNGRWIAYYGGDNEHRCYQNIGLYVVPVDGSAQVRNLTEAYDINVSCWTINDLGQPESMPPTWSNDGQTIYFPVTLHGNSLLKSISLQGGNLQDIIHSTGVVGSFSFDQHQRRLAFFFGALDNPCQIHLMEMESAKQRPLTQLNQELLQTFDLGQIETVWFKGPDNNDLQGWILKPPGFDPKKKYPSILEIHGGPMTQYGNFFMHEFYFLASQGYIVHFCNPRGGRGYGQEHTKAIWGAWGTADYADLIAWTDHVATLPYIDASRMGVTGGSYGGYMTVWIIGHTQRFKAAVAQRCVSNFIIMWGSSDFNWAFQFELQSGAPFEDLQKFWDMSPIKYIGNARTPTLVIHNENDQRCPIEQGEQVFVALKRLGVETEFVRFPEEFHGLSRSGRTDRRVARLNHIARWFNLHL